MLIRLVKGRAPIKGPVAFLTDKEDHHVFPVSVHDPRAQAALASPRHREIVQKIHDNTKDPAKKAAHAEYLAKLGGKKAPTDDGIDASALSPWKKGKFEIATSAGKHDATGWRSEHFGVHKVPSKFTKEPYRVTHLRTGLSTGMSAATLEDAQAMASALEHYGGDDWKFSRQEDAPRSIYDHVKIAGQSYGKIRDARNAARIAKAEGSRRSYGEKRPTKDVKASDSEVPVWDKRREGGVSANGGAFFSDGHSLVFEPGATAGGGTNPLGMTEKDVMRLWSDFTSDASAAGEAHLADESVMQTASTIRGRKALTPVTEISDGKRQGLVDVAKVRWMQKRTKATTMRLTSSVPPAVVMYKDDQPVGIVMGRRTEEPMAKGDTPKKKPDGFITVGGSKEDGGHIIPVWGFHPHPEKPGKLVVESGSGHEFEIDKDKHEAVKDRIHKAQAEARGQGRLFTARGKPSKAAKEGASAEHKQPAHGEHPQNVSRDAMDKYLRKTAHPSNFPNEKGADEGVGIHTESREVMSGGRTEEQREHHNLYLMNDGSYAHVKHHPEGDRYSVQRVNAHEATFNPKHPTYEGNKRAAEISRLQERRDFYRSEHERAAKMAADADNGDAGGAKRYRSVAESSKKRADDISARLKDLLGDAKAGASVAKSEIESRGKAREKVSDSPVKAPAPAPKREEKTEPEGDAKADALAKSHARLDALNKRVAALPWANHDLYKHLPSKAAVDMHHRKQTADVVNEKMDAAEAHISKAERAAMPKPESGAKVEPTARRKETREDRRDEYHEERYKDGAFPRFTHGDYSKAPETNWSPRTFDNHDYDYVVMPNGSVGYLKSDRGEVSLEMADGKTTTFHNGMSMMAHLNGVGARALPWSAGTKSAPKAEPKPATPPDADTIIGHLMDNEGSVTKAKAALDKSHPGWREGGDKAFDSAHEQYLKHHAPADVQARHRAAQLREKMKAGSAMAGGLKGEKDESPPSIAPESGGMETNEKPSRLGRLKASLEKKKAKVQGALDAHFADVASANGQPLNDKRNGAATMNRWERQSNAIRAAHESMSKTERAIEREEWKIADVKHANSKLPKHVLDMVEDGSISQWRRHPNTFFVPGVDKGRIVIDLKTGAIGVRYMNAIPKDQYPKFRDVVNAMLAKQRAAKATQGQAEK